MLFIMEEYIQIITTTEKKEEAEKIAKILVEKRLAGCIQIIGPIISTYWWKNKIEQANEVVLIAKTKKDNWEKLKAEIKSIHPYSIPCIAKIEVEVNEEFKK